MSATTVTYRPATPFDAPRIAALHAQSWQENYRGALTDEYLDREATAERLSVWTERFSQPNDDMQVMLAEAGNQLVGFCCVFLHHDPQDGALLDNLHVRAEYQGRGVGRRLIRWAAVIAVAADPENRLHLWVLKTNTSAAAVYRHLGGRTGRTESKQLVPGQPAPVEAICVHFDAEQLI
ncbi:ribosomal protein S18 acetylase RimI-like enzyme [Neolewinella xylanilytica]|uniref:Ribosomal protein S18 acetylase RimI-like enzyme n=1 Tax=Neolewinella xylanilytica TaxID=1514080 RepID=A0A2S6I0L5_9BACT|nr:GNAT family N-acetyltransferase [Neolewinella xylanilytica]PPK84519.1 ribosomal protein S18 acetylase RimI-like enzyme [Neolewinella xylanilytica]